MAKTPMDRVTRVSLRKPRVMAYALRQQIEAMRDAITADNAAVVDAITATEAEADKTAIVAALATVKTGANTQAAARVAAINVELDKLKDALA